MDSHQGSTQPVIIAGGGPVGLFLAACLDQWGISSVILEKRVAPRPGSRSLGIHPVCLELFQQLDIAGPFVREGRHITAGHAYSNSRKIATLSFKSCPKPFNFILALPQVRTEQLLEQHLRGRERPDIRRGAEVTGFSQQRDEVSVTYRKDGISKTIRGCFLVGCDGKQSITRKEADIPLSGKPYPDSYIMGDFSDNTGFGSDAAIFLCQEGLIESFPLPDSRRRWVVKTDSYQPDPKRGLIEGLVHERIGHSLRDAELMMLSSFGVQRYLAEPMVKERLVLAGDAAHIVSPIGGQGMNLGWLGAWDLSRSLRRILQEQRDSAVMLQDFERRRRKAVANATRRSELNMRLGRKSRFPVLRNALVRVLLSAPLSPLAARLFTMRGVERWII